ncbi:hypothetical protein PVAND_006613 [Polypedilum vanderplanki]|uniref:TGF-beta family profile domain-containing protein n=1 Tax=Polypedilum vanderplanki TaxID=319348 RepID=A0A9J6C4I4_POLVA|nr:hypothetical protein PVAND_006613 [Polypedilum vanderplanki]
MNFEIVYWLVLSYVIILLNIVSSAEIGHSKRIESRHHKSDKNHDHNTKRNFVREFNSNSDSFKRTLPPNIWALLASNSLMNRNQTMNDDDDNSAKYKIDLDFENDATTTDPPPHADDESIKTKIAANCPKCKQNSVKMSEDELTNLRIEFVKNQILHKLRMNERPPKKVIDEIPEPIQEGYTIQANDDTDYLNRHLDDYFAKTTQKIIFLTQEFEKCKLHQSKDYPSLCFSFTIPSDIDVNTVDSARLWMYKQQQTNNLDHGMNHTFLLSEVGFWGANTKFIKSKPLAITEIDENNSGWEKIDIELPVKNWVEFDSLTHTVQISCETCISKTLPISLYHDHKPFIVIDTFPQRTFARQKRNQNCGPGSTECCRDSLYIDFATIGWNDWIIHPKGYNAYFCRGSCNRVASITQAETHHSTVFNKFLHNTSKNNKKKLELVPCCTATRYSSLQIFYLDTNNTATQVTLPNMIVESCGCS